MRDEYSTIRSWMMVGKLLLDNNCSQSIVSKLTCTLMMMEFSTSVKILGHA